MVYAVAIHVVVVYAVAIYVVVVYAVAIYAVVVYAVLSWNILRRSQSFNSCEFLGSDYDLC